MISIPRIPVQYKFLTGCQHRYCLDTSQTHETHGITLGALGVPARCPPKPTCWSFLESDMDVSVLPGFEHQSSQGRLLQSDSPLDTLVRRTSSRRLRKATGHTKQASSGNSILPSLPPCHAPPPAPCPVSPPRPSTSPRVPDFPLLHSNFRSSTSSAVTNVAALHSSWQNTKSFLSFTDDCDADDGCREEDNNYGQRPQPSSSHNNYSSYPAFATPSASSTHLASQTDLWPQATGLTQPATLSYTDPEPMQPPPSPLPTVVVSSPQDDGPRSNGPMRQPIVFQGDLPRMNFSRPGRPPILSSEEQKRRVLERNAQRANSPRTSPSLASLGPVTPVTGVYPDDLHKPSPLAPWESSTSYPPSSSSYLHRDGAHPSPSLAPPNSIALLSQPPSMRVGSPYSLYSNSYSFYQLDSAVPSPTFQSPRSTPDVSPATSRPASDEPQTPEEFLQLGIQYHEANQLRDSAVCFEKSAKEQGGCSVGMLMWGLTLRHGWGCEKNEKGGFKWLTKAAESAVEDLEKARKGLDVGGVRVSCPLLVCRQLPHVHWQEELVLAIYEVGQCFFQGWGVAKDQKMAVVRDLLLIACRGSRDWCRATIELPQNLEMPMLSRI